MENFLSLGNDFYYVGGSDRRLALFENVYPVPRGVSYNSYLLNAEKSVLFDTADSSVSELFFENVEGVLKGKPLDYLIIQHMEPDHSSSFMGILKRYPKVKVVVNQKSATMLKNYFPEAEYETVLVKEGDVLSIGGHVFKFIFAPMVHWPEVMLTYDESTKTLFSADAFGTFGALSGSIYADEVHYEEEFLAEARRYYFNIVGKYGAQVQSVLKKASALEIERIYPLHGPVWRKNLSEILNLYNVWSSYAPEEKGVVIFTGTIYGHTMNAAEILAAELLKKGIAPKLYDVSKTEVSLLVAEAFRYSHSVFASATYNNGIFVKMEELLSCLAAHNFQNRVYSIIENGSWAPQAGKLMREKLSSMKNMTETGEGVTMLSSVKAETREKITALAEAIASCYYE